MQKSQKAITAFLRARNWQSDNPVDYAKSISIEAAELLELFQWRNPDMAELLKDKKLTQKVQQELADVLIYSLEFASMLGVDAEDIVKEKMAYNNKKYPVTKVRGRSVNYYKIKESFRKKKS